MKTHHILFLLVFVIAVTASSERTGAAAEFGWEEIPGTQIRTVCPPDQVDGGAGWYEFSFYCDSVTDAWSGAIADTLRNRMIIWGGGHGDYYGNELYAFDLATQQLTRLNNPTIPTNRNDSGTCNVEIPPGVGGMPNSRHTYGGLVYIEHADKMYAFSGSLACGGGSSGRDTWILDLETLTWQRMDPTNGTSPGSQLVDIADYDPVTQLVYLLNRSGLYTYEYETNTYTLLRDNLWHPLPVHGAIDPVRGLFITAGYDGGGAPVLGAIAIRTGDHARVDWTATAAATCPSLAYRNPGMAYDPVQDRMIIWGGGETVDLLNLDTHACTTVAAPSAPTPVSTGVYGRFRYFPDYNYFVSVNEVDDNTFILRLTDVDTADLALTSLGSLKPGVINQPLTYTLQTSNNGPLTATHVVLTDTLPSEAVFDSATTPQGNCSEMGGVVNCALGELEPGARITTTITVVPTGIGLVTNLAVASADQPDINVANNTAMNVSYIFAEHPEELFLPVNIK